MTAALIPSASSNAIATSIGGSNVDVVGEESGGSGRDCTSCSSTACDEPSSSILSLVVPGATAEIRSTVEEVEEEVVVVVVEEEDDDEEEEEAEATPSCRDTPPTTTASDQNPVRKSGETTSPAVSPCFLERRLLRLSPSSSSTLSGGGGGDCRRRRRRCSSDLERWRCCSAPRRVARRACKRRHTPIPIPPQGESTRKRHAEMQ